MLKLSVNKAVGRYETRRGNRLQSVLTYNSKARFFRGKKG